MSKREEVIADLRGHGFDPKLGARKPDEDGYSGVVGRRREELRFNFDTTTVDYYRGETHRLRANIEALSAYCERKASEHRADGDTHMDSFNRGMAVVYEDIARKLSCAAYSDVEWFVKSLSDNSLLDGV